MLEVAEIKHWLREACRRGAIVPVKCLIFGSVLRQNDPSDVDVVFVFQENEVRGFLTKIKFDFKRKFGVPIHVQIFHSTQTKEIIAFIKFAQFVEDVL